MIRQHKIAIVGAGLVGGSAALFAAYSIPGVEIVLIDVEPVRAEGQVLDLAHAAAIWRSADFRAGDYRDARGADIVVITAGVGVKKGTDATRPRGENIAASQKDRDGPHAR